MKRALIAAAGIAFAAVCLAQLSKYKDWGKSAEAGMTARVVHACEDLLSAGHALT